MRLATLVTNTDFSDFAKARPLDDAKFAALIHSVRPDWQVEAFWACKNEFSQDLAGFDGVMITGSPASVMDGAPWMLRLEDLILDMVQARIPLFGACFGHQLIAKALGAKVFRNPDGWAHGLIAVERMSRAPWSMRREKLDLFGSHIEQVSLPDGAELLFQSQGCRNAGFAIGNHVFTVQHHPEMSSDFIADLIEEYADYVGLAVTNQARASINSGSADGGVFAREIAAFFEQANSR